MNRRNIYLLVPQKGVRNLVKGIDAERIRVVGGRANAERQRDEFERELNGGKTWNELLSGCKSLEEIDRVAQDGWQVHSDTDRSWSEMKSYATWPERVQTDIEALLDGGAA